MRRPNMVGRINHFKHREGMGCAILVVNMAWIAGFLALAIMLPTLVRNPWIIPVIGIAILGYFIFQGFNAATKKPDYYRLTIMPTELELESAIELGVRITRVRIAPAHTCRMIEHLRKNVQRPFEVEINAGIKDNFLYDRLVIRGDDGEKAVISFPMIPSA